MIGVPYANKHSTPACPIVPVFHWKFQRWMYQDQLMWLNKATAHAFVFITTKPRRKARNSHHLSADQDMGCLLPEGMCHCTCIWTTVPTPQPPSCATLNTPDDKDHTAQDRRETMHTAVRSCAPEMHLQCLMCSGQVRKKIICLPSENGALQPHDQVLQRQG